MIDWGAFLAFSVLLTLAPGPDSFVVIRSTVLRGRRDGLATVAGSVAGTLVWALFAAAGLAALLTASAEAYTVVKACGAAYLVVLGVMTLCGRDRERAETGAASSSRSGWAAARNGFVVDLLNPKVGLFFVAVLPQFVNASAPRWAPLALGVVDGVIAAAWLVVLSVCAHRAARVLRSDRARRILRRLTGLALLGFGVKVASET